MDDDTAELGVSPQPTQARTQRAAAEESRPRAIQDDDDKVDHDALDPDSTEAPPGVAHASPSSPLALAPNAANTMNTKSNFSCDQGLARLLQKLKLHQQVGERL
jgi:hypothetical protein